MTPPSIQQEICRLYPTTSTRLLAERYGVSKITISNIVKRHGGKVRPSGLGHDDLPWTPAEDIIIRDRFAVSENLKEVMPYLPGRTYNAIRTRANACLGVKMKKLPVHDTHCFDTPTEVNCSWAGYLAADGCISDKGRLALGIASKDRTHVEDLIRYMGFTGRIYDYVRPYKDLKVKKYGKISTYAGVLHTSSVQIQCPAVCVQLATHWNITPRKTHTLIPPNLTDDRLIVAYLSGFIDGDGWIVEDKSTAHTQYNIGVMGTTEMMTWVKVTFDRLVGGTDRAALQPTESTNICDYKVSGVKVYWLAKLFLSLDVPRLERKWVKLRRFIERVENGDVTQRLKGGIRAACPSEDTLIRFGLIEDRDRLFASIRPSVQ